MFSEPVDVDEVEAPKEVVLRPYQREAAGCVKHEWSIGNRSTLVVAATGLGKSVIFSAVLKEVLA